MDDVFVKKIALPRVSYQHFVVMTFCAVLSA